jgi:hypothetical protein
MAQNVEADNNYIKKAECSECGGLRNCDIRGDYEQSGGDDYFDWSVTWNILQCRDTYLSRQLALTRQVAPAFRFVTVKGSFCCGCAYPINLS